MLIGLGFLIKQHTAYKSKHLNVTLVAASTIFQQKFKRPCQIKGLNPPIKAALTLRWNVFRLFFQCEKFGYGPLT